MTSKSSKGCASDLRRIDPLHSAEVADAFRCVSQMVAFIIDPVSCLFITQVLLQLVLGSSVSSSAVLSPLHHELDRCPFSSLDETDILGLPEEGLLSPSKPSPFFA